MKKFFLSTCLIVMASLAFSQGYFTEKEIKDNKLEVKYDKVNDLYFYKLKGKNEGGQNENFKASITYHGKTDTALLYLTFTHQGKSLIGLKEALVYIDGETMAFKPSTEKGLSRNRIDKGAYYYYYENLFFSVSPEYKEDMKYLNFFYLGLEDAQSVKVRLMGSAGDDQFTLKPKEIKATDKMISLYMDKEFPDED